MLHKTAWITCAPHNGPGWGAVKVEASGSEHDLDGARYNRGRGGSFNARIGFAPAFASLRKLEACRSGARDLCIHGRRIRQSDSLPEWQGVMRLPENKEREAFPG